MEQPSSELRWRICLQLSQLETMSRDRRSWIRRSANFFLTSSPSGRVRLKNRIENTPSRRVALPSHYLVTTFSIFVWVLPIFKLPRACLHHSNCMQDRPGGASFKSPYLRTDSSENTGAQGSLQAAKPTGGAGPVHKQSVPARPWASARLARVC